MEKIDQLMESEDLAWRDILYSVLSDMNPWDVDIVELATRYSLKVDEMAQMNFRLPANVVLVCSVLLRMKADILSPIEEEYPSITQALDFIFSTDYPIAALLGSEVEPYPIQIKPTREMTRKVTAQELIDAIQDALHEKTKRVEQISLKNTKAALRIMTSDDPKEVLIEPALNFLELAEETFRLVEQILKSKEAVVFSDIAKTKEEIINIFLSLLHLSNNQRISLDQKYLFGEIYIRGVPAQ